MDADAASATIGVCDSASGSSMASAFGVVLGPTTMSTFSSVVSLRRLRTALVVSDASSRMMYSTFWPATSLGHSSIALRVGAPIAAAGPVVEIVTPTLICAWADCATSTDSEIQDMPANQRKNLD